MSFIRNTLPYMAVSLRTDFKSIEIRRISFYTKREELYTKPNSISATAVGKPSSCPIIIIIFTSAPSLLVWC